MSPFILADDADAAAGLVGTVFGCFFFIFYIGVIVLIIAGMWKMFVKAGEPGWAAIIPIYNSIILLKICNKPIWWFILLLIPCVGIIFSIIILVELAKSFGKTPVYAVGMILLPFVFIPMLGFGKAQYIGTKSAF